MVGLRRTTHPKKTQDSAKILNLRRNQENFYDNYVALVKKLAAEEYTPSRIAACRILYAFYGRLSAQAKDEMWKILRRFSADDNIPVRKEVVTTLANFAKEADTELYTSYIIPVLEKMVEEEEEKIEPCLELTQLIMYICTWPHVPEDARQGIIPVLMKHSRHPSWEVRHMIANNFKEMFRRIWSRLFPRELDCCFRGIFKKVRAADDEDLEEVCGEEVTKVESQPPTTLMAGLEETTDAEGAQNGARDLKIHQNQDTFCDNYVAVVENLAAEKYVASRIAACRILHAFFGRVSPQARAALWNTLLLLSVDDDMCVRRMLVTILANLAKEADTHMYTSCIIPVLENLTEGKQDEPCLEATQLVIYISTWPHVPEDARQAVIPVLLKLARHPSWEVRYMIADNINKILVALRVHIFDSGLIAVLPNLMQDYDSRVRDAANNQFLQSCTD